MRIMQYLFAWLAVICTSWSQCAAQCSPLPDQGQIFDTTGILHVETDIWSQSITAGRTGQLTGIQFQIENPSVLPANFGFSLHEGGNPPMGQPLYSQLLTITSADLEGPGLFTWDVTDANLLVNGGYIFTFSFSVQTAGIAIAGNDEPGYGGGELFHNGKQQPPNAILDIAFISYVCVETDPIFVVASQYNIFRGNHLSGDLSDTFQSDDSYLKFNPGFVVNSSEPPVWIEFEGTLPTDNPSSLSVTLEAAASTLVLTQTIEAFNWTTGQYEEVDSRTASFNTDSVVTVDLSDGLQDFVEPGIGSVKTRVGWKSAGYVLYYPWTICIDQVVWTVTQ
jgi:hypothetical protein